MINKRIKSKTAVLSGIVAISLLAPLAHADIIFFDDFSEDTTSTYTTGLSATQNNLTYAPAGAPTNKLNWTSNYTIGQYQYQYGAANVYSGTVGYPTHTTASNGSPNEAYLSPGGGTGHANSGVLSDLTTPILTSTGAAVNLVAGASYTISLDVGSRNDQTVSTLGVDLFAGSTLVDPTVTVGSNSFTGDVTLSQLTAGKFTNFTFTIPASALTSNSGALSIELANLSNQNQVNFSDIVVSDIFGTTYTLSTSAAASRILVGQSTTLSTKITNTGGSSYDTLSYTGLGNSVSPAGTIGGSTTNSSTPVANSNGSNTNSGQTFTGTTAGVQTITPLVASATNYTGGTSAGSPTSTTTATVDVVNSRTFSTPTAISLGRFLISGTPSGSTTVSSTGLNNVTENATLGSFSSVDGLSLGLSSGSASFTGASSTQTAGYTVGGTATTAGAISGSFSSTVTSELGDTIAPVTVAVSGNALNLRTISNGATTNLGTLHSGASVSGTANAFSSTGANASTTSVQVAGGSGSADSKGVTLTGSTTSFTGGTSGSVNGSTQTFGGTITNATGGTTTGSFNLAATTLESGLGDTYSPVTVAYTANVYTGKSTWNTASSGAWGTITGTTPDSAFTGNWTANGGAPGVTAGFNGVDTATFGAQSSGAVTVGLNNAAPNVNSITFSSPATSYTIAQNQGSGSGSNLITLSGTTPSINVTGNATAGSQTISAPINILSNTSVNVGSKQTLNLTGVISDPGQSMTYTGPGTTITTADNTYTGGTTITGGTLYVNNTGGASYTAPITNPHAAITATNTTGSGTGTGAVLVQSGGTLAGSGTIKSTSGGITVQNGGTLSSGGIQSGTTAGQGLTLNNAANLSSALTVNGGATLTFALGSTTQWNVGSNTFANPDTNSSYLSLTGSTPDQIFANTSTADNIDLVDLTNGSNTVSLTLRSQQPYLLIQTALGNNADFSNLWTTGGEGANGYVLGISTGVGNAYTAFNLAAYDVSGNQINTASNLEGLKLYLYNGDLEVVPEPGTCALMLGGLGALLFFQRMRRGLKV